MAAKAPSAQILASRTARSGRGVGSAAHKAARIEWFFRNVMSKISTSLKGKVMLATWLVHKKVTNNISRAVTKGVGPKGGRVVTNRSTPGEFPKAETTQLMKTLLQDVRKDSKGNWVGYIGTPLDYGVILELKRDRSFLKRTLKEEYSTIKRILTGPIK